MTNASTETKIIPEGSAARFECSACKGKVTGTVLLDVRAITTSVDELIARGRMKAARRFKKDHGLHPCTKVDVTYRGLVLA